MIRGEGKGFKRRSARRIALLAVLLVGMMGTAAFGHRLSKSTTIFRRIRCGMCIPRSR